MTCKYSKTLQLCIAQEVFLSVPAQCRLVSILVVSEAVCVLVVTYFECVFCQSNVGLFLVVVVSCHCRLVYYTFGLALSIQRACFALSAVTVFLCYESCLACRYS